MIFIPNITWWLGSIYSPKMDAPKMVRGNSHTIPISLGIRKWEWNCWWFRNPAITSWGIPLFTRFLHIPGGAGFLQSTVWVWERGPMSLGVSENPTGLSFFAQFPRHTVDGSEILLTSWGKGCLSHYLRRVSKTTQVVVWDFWPSNSRSSLPNANLKHNWNHH